MKGWRKKSHKKISSASVKKWNQKSGVSYQITVHFSVLIFFYHEPLLSLQREKQLVIFRRKKQEASCYQLSDSRLMPVTCLPKFFCRVERL